MPFCQSVQTSLMPTMVACCSCLRMIIQNSTHVYKDSCSCTSSHNYMSGIFWQPCLHCHHNFLLCLWGDNPNSTQNISLSEMCTLPTDVAVEKLWPYLGDHYFVFFFLPCHIFLGTRQNTWFLKIIRPLILVSHIIGQID